MLQIAHYHCQEIVEVVGDATSQLSNRLHLLGLTKLFFSRLLFRDVPRDLGEPQQAAGSVANSVDYDIGHEGGSVLAAAPTLRFVFSGPLRGREGGSGQSYLAVIFGIETREVMAEDFGR